jgi:membrane protein required for colicin V production
MTALDWIIVLVLALSVLQGLRRGLIMALLSLAGMVAGIFLAARYWYLALPLVRRFCSTPWLSQLFSYFLVAFFVFLVFTLVARLLRRAARSVGLGWLDRLLGAAFGLLRGLFAVVLGFIIVAAFLPRFFQASGSRFAPFFLSAAQVVTRSAPPAAASKVVFGLQRGPRAGQR